MSWGQQQKGKMSTPWWEEGSPPTSTVQLESELKSIWSRGLQEELELRNVHALVRGREFPPAQCNYIQSYLNNVNTLNNPKNKLPASKSFSPHLTMKLWWKDEQTVVK